MHQTLALEKYSSKSSTERQYKDDPKKNSTKIFDNKKGRNRPPTKNPNIEYFGTKKLEPVRDANANITEFHSAGTKFYHAAYGKLYVESESITEARIKAWKNKIASGTLKLCGIPPTSESSEDNIDSSTPSCSLENGHYRNHFKFILFSIWL